MWDDKNSPVSLELRKAMGFLGFLCRLKGSSKNPSTLQGGPLPIISEVISPINGLING